MHKPVIEQEIADFLLSLSVQIKRNDRQIIKPLELDIVIPEKKIAIEFNGDYWHSVQAGTDKNYHLIKTKMCEEAGYRLIHIFEHEWDFQQKIIKEKLKAIFLCRLSTFPPFRLLTELRFRTTFLPKPTKRRSSILPTAAYITKLSKPTTPTTGRALLQTQPL